MYVYLKLLSFHDECHSSTLHDIIDCLEYNPAISFLADTDTSVYLHGISISRSTINYFATWAATVLH